MKAYWIVTIVVSLTAAGGCAGIGEKHHLSDQQVIRSLQLQPLSDDACPGYYLPTYESGLKAALDKDRAAASLIYYLMTKEIPIDPWHILTSDEVLLYHAGAPLIQMLLYPDGAWEDVILGPQADKGQVMQKVIPAGTWMGFIKKDDPIFDWGLYGVLVVPAWNIEDIRMLESDAEREELEKKYPAAVPRGRELGLF